MHVANTSNTYTSLFLSETCHACHSRLYRGEEEQSLSLHLGGCFLASCTMRKYVLIYIEKYFTMGSWDHPQGTVPPSMQWLA